MGCEWTVTDHTLSTSYYSFNCNITLWCSPIKAKTVAVLSLLLVAPDNINIHLHFDSQNTINGLSDLYKTDSSTSKKYYNRPNFLIWLTIDKLLQTKNIALDIIKVQAHTRDLNYRYKLENNLADASAK